MGVESFCSCSKDCGEGSFTFQQNNRSMNNSASKEKQNLNQLNQKPNLKLIDNFYRNNNLINTNYFSINSTNPHDQKRWQNCVIQKNSAEVFYGRASEISSFNNSINYINSNNLPETPMLNIPLGDKYEGEMKNNRPFGKGIYHSITGEIREGEFIDGKLNGPGKMTLSNGFFIEGNFVNDELDGFGMTLNMITGEKYEGEFKNGIREGKGKLIMSNEDRFEGNFIHGKLEGQGKFIKKNGEIYEGSFENGIPSGKGHKKYEDGGEYEGEFKNGKENGFGIKKGKDGQIYEGEFLDGMKHGKGKHIFNDGQKYEGDFYEDHYNGKGIYIWPDDLKYIGEFKDDKIEGKGTLIWPNGDKYEGSFIDGKYNGYGIEIKTDGSKYEGDFHDDDYEGNGIKIFPNGEKYEGEFHKGEIDGKGVWTYNDGTTLEGIWNLGNKNGIFKKKNPDGKINIVEYKNNIIMKEEDSDNIFTNDKSQNGIIQIEINEDKKNNTKNGGDDINIVNNDNIDNKNGIDEINNNNKSINNKRNINEKNKIINEEFQNEIGINNDETTIINFNEENFNEFTFILLTNLEAKKMSLELAKEKIILNQNDINKYTNEEFISKIQKNISQYLDCENEVSLINIQNWLNYLLSVNDNDQNIMQNEFLAILSNIKEYPQEQELFLNKKVKKYLLPKKNIIFEKLNLSKNNNNKYISFKHLKTIIEDEKIELKEQYFVFLFYALKKFDDPKANLEDLKYDILFDILNNTENDSKMDEESDLEISDDEYNQIIADFQMKLINYINNNHTNLRFILNGLIQVLNIEEENNVVEVVLIRPFFERMKEIGIWDNNELEIYCIFNRYKLSEKYEGINIYLLEEELKNMKASMNKNNKYNNEVNKQIIMENIKEENEESSIE